MIQLDRKSAADNAAFMDSILNQILGIPTSQAKPYHPASQRTLTTVEPGSAEVTIHLSRGRITIPVGRVQREIRVTGGAWGRLVTALERYAAAEINRAERKFRHQANIATKQGKDALPAPQGNYYD